MTKPLALLFYEKLLPGSQLLNRLQDLGYRVHSCHEVNKVLELAKSEKPMLVLLDMLERQGRVPTIIQSLKKAPETSHLPIIAFAGEKEKILHDAARLAGATIVVSETSLLPHLEAFLEQALHIE